MAFLLLKTSPDAHKLPLVPLVATRRGRVLVLSSSVVVACLMTVILTYYPLCIHMYAIDGGWGDAHMRSSVTPHCAYCFRLLLDAHRCKRRYDCSFSSDWYLTASLSTFWLCVTTTLCEFPS